MGRGEEVGARRQAAQIENDCKIRVKSLDNCNSTPGCFFRCAAAIRGDGDNIIATWAEVRKNHMGRIHSDAEESLRGRYLSQYPWSCLRG